jgi:hypothetical protein
MKDNKFIIVVNATTVAALMVVLAQRGMHGIQMILVVIISLLFTNAAAVVGLYLRKK